MKKVKFLTSIAGHDFSYKPGDEATLEPQIAEAWEASGICQVLPPEPKESKKPEKNEAAKASK